MSRVLVATHNPEIGTAIGLQLRSVGANVDGLETEIVLAQFPRIGGFEVSVLVDEMIVTGIEGLDDVVGIVMVIDSARKSFRNDVAQLVEAAANARPELPVVVGIIGTVPVGLASEIALILDRRPVQVPIFSIDIRSRTDILTVLAALLFQAEETLASS